MEQVEWLIKSNGQGDSLLYEKICTEVRQSAHAKGAVVIVIDGVDGSAVYAQGSETMKLILPEMLEALARDLRGHGAQ